MVKWSVPCHGQTRIALVGAIAVAVGTIGGWHMRGAPAGADEDVLAVAKAEVDRFYQATSGRVPLSSVLGNAFQIMRTDGSRFDRGGYLAHPATLQDYTLNKFQAVQSGEVLTVTFFAGLTGTVDDVRRESSDDPRLAVFSRVDGAWKLQAFANLGQGLAVGLDSEARAAVQTWVEAVASGDSGTLRAVLAPEFQIVRADGSAHDAAGYLAGGTSKIDAVLGLEDVVATGYGDHMIVRYTLGLKSSVDGKTMQEKAPRLTVFRRKGDAWLVAAHANFARPSN